MADKIKCSFFPHKIPNIQYCKSNHILTFPFNQKNHNSQRRPDLSFSKNKYFNEAQPHPCTTTKPKIYLREERRARSWGNQRRARKAFLTPSFRLDKPEAGLLTAEIKDLRSEIFPKLKRKGLMLAESSGWGSLAEELLLLPKHSDEKGPACKESGSFR